MKLIGNRTYIVAGATIVYALLGLILGHLEPSHAVEVILAALGGIFMRASIPVI